MQSVVMLSVIYDECLKQVHYAECYYADCRYAECRYTKCRYAECRGTPKTLSRDLHSSLSSHTNSAEEKKFF
jgi:hypothetical protein